MKTLTKFTLMTGLLMVAMAANAQDLTVTSTAIIGNFTTACASKGNDTDVLITKAETANRDLSSLLHQSSVVNDSQIYVPPVTFFNSCAYSQPICYGGYYGEVCNEQCIGTWQTNPGYYQDNYRCDTTVSVDSPAYVLALSAGTPAQLDAAMAGNNVIYSEVDHGNARWITVNQK